MTDAGDAPEDIKADFKERLLWVCRTFGGSTELLRRLPVAERRRLRSWVRALEDLAARLVRALAAGLEAEPSRPWPARPRGPAEPCRPLTDDPDSARWTGLRCRIAWEPPAPMEPARPAAPCAFPPRPDAVVQIGARSARGLAIRLEAAVRVVADPMGPARRLARRRARKTSPSPSRRAPRQSRSPGGPPRIAWLGPPPRIPLGAGPGRPVVSSG